MDGLSDSLVTQMYNVRVASPEDFHAVLPMAEKFYNSTSFSKLLPFDVPSILEFYIHMLEKGFVIVAETEDGSLAGMLGASIHPFHLNINHLVCTEAMWWVEPEHRGQRLAGDMLDMFERMAKTAGCTLTCMAKLDTTPEGVGAYYESRGYRATETSYIKEA